MASLPRAFRVSQSSSTLTSHREQQGDELTENGAFILGEARALPTEDDAFIADKAPSLKDEYGYPSISPKAQITRKPVSPKDTRSQSITTLVGGFVAGVALAISHHLFLAFLNGRYIDEYPQYWVKNANNAISAVFSLCIAFVATVALTQMKWNAAGSKPLSIGSIDNLFALPSPLALFTTATSTRLQSLRLLLIPMLAATFIQSLALVSIFAPNALTVARSAQITRDLQVPTLDLSTGPITSITSLYDNKYTSASQLWTTLLTSVMLQPPLLNWKIPPGCGAMCKFDLVYEGPGLQCTDTPSESPSLDTLTVFYNGTNTLRETSGSGFLGFWEIEDQYELQIRYIATNDNSDDTGRDGGSVQCVFRNTTYKASFQMENNTMQVDHSIESYGDILGTIKYGPDSPCSRNLTVPCFINGVNTRAMCDVFATAFSGTIQFNGSAPAEPTETTGGINIALADQFFSHTLDDMTRNFHLAVPSLSEGLVSLFSNLTLGYIPQRPDTTTVQAEIWDGSFAWSYTVWILWAVYLPTLLLASLVMLNGLLSIRSNKRGMETKFSHFLLKTRNSELDEVCMDVDNFEELELVRLLYQRETGTFSIASEEYTK